MIDTHLLGRKIGGVRVVPLTVKILVVFVSLVLVSSFSTNYINLTLNRGVYVNLMNELLVKELKEMYTFASNQYDIYQFSKNLNDTVSALESNAGRDFKLSRSLALGVKGDGSVFFHAGKEAFTTFPDKKVLEKLESDRKDKNIQEGSLYPTIGGRDYFGVYKYNEKWDLYLMRLEDRGEFYQPTQVIFAQIGIIILIITFVFTVLGMLLMRYILRFVPRITDALMRMQESQRMELIDLENAPNDEVTYLGTSFNALSSSINNLMVIFKTFVTQDVVNRAYQEREIRLEGTQKELTILFSDIKGFTFMTETLGNDIIALLNIHYDRAIRRIHGHNGIVGSIIGDALLTIYGTLTEGAVKSLDALLSAYEIQSIAQSLRDAMTERKEIIEKERGGLTPAEMRVYKAVMLEVGVGIDGGQVFYGNIGSTERMTNTVIGDNVNSASRLEGLTRIYRVPIVCSEYVVQEVRSVTDRFVFIELDTVQVKGKTEGKKIFFPMDTQQIQEGELQRYETFSEGLKQYYQGRWDEARKAFNTSAVLPAAVFLQRIEGRTAPEGWNGVWTMDTK